MPLPTTRWSLVLATRDSGSQQARDALTVLCQTYWSPVHDFVQHQGRSPDDARDLTQAFFARVIEKGDFRNARPELGRFRTFLLTTVRHFLANQYDHDHAAKRGGGATIASIDAPATGDAITPTELTTRTTPETIYERRWALTTLATAMSRLADECTKGDRSGQFEALRPFLTGAETAPYAQLAARLRIAEGSVRVALHRLRRRYGECLREVLTETVEDPADVDDELQYLLAVLSR